MKSEDRALSRQRGGAFDDFSPPSGPQNKYLFNDLRNNVLIARPSATPAELAAAIRHASLGDLVAALPREIDSNMGERGTSLSGGQCQRVAIACALLMDAPVPILDEATSHLDAVTGQAVRPTLAILPADRTDHRDRASPLDGTKR